MKTESIKNICNLGTGTMGHGTALMFATAGYNVVMYGPNDVEVEKGFTGIKNGLETYCKHGLIKEEGIPAIIGRIKGVTTLEEAAADADFVIESVPEVLAIKQKVFSAMEKLCPPTTIFATNTSGLSPTAIAEVLTHKERFVVAHFWNPPHLVPLVEVVPGKHTANETVQTTWELMKKIGKKPVALKREALGFIGNRLQFALLREALYIIESGIATEEAVDTTVKYSLGRRLSTTGPLESADLGGLDIFYNISTYLMKDLCNDSGVSSLLQKAMDQGTLGAKTGTGLYDWTPKGLARIKKIREDNLLEWLQKDQEIEL
ncbi:3-hydroxybutyryl-CoA dehydrogenase [bioreactor metagenome]|uniref:L-gulonate 3-dehydrogenase n=1 Tax=bioreactor metagenome TaxID=1076179 RepID=A0A644TQZ3_9ZZZZ|nr:3-hydroxyacyl-CoA dehydrogenase NAD-binding domain-containing protein [Negativicutes bacterium]